MNNLIVAKFRNSDKKDLKIKPWKLTTINKS